MTHTVRRIARSPTPLLAWIARRRTAILLALTVLAVLLRVLAIVYCPTPFGYVYDYYHEAIELFWETGRLPIASDCWQCYHPPLFYLLGLPFYAFGRWITAGLDSSPDWGLRCLTLLPLVAGALTTAYSAMLVDRLVPDRGLSVLGIAVVFAFPCLFISSYATEADIVVAACMTMFLFYLTEWMAKPGAGWRWPAGVGLIAGLAA